MASLSEKLSQAGVQDTFTDKLIEDGWTSDHFALAAPSLEKFDDELKAMLGDLFEITTAQQRSAFRLAWSRCQSTAMSSSPSQTPPAVLSNDGPSTQSSWSETFPPKLNAQVVLELTTIYETLPS